MTDRGSSRHGARVDDELKSESASLTRGSPVEAHVEAWRQAEPAAEGEPEPDALPSRTEIEERSLLAASLRPSAFPGDRAGLVEIARAEHATDEVMSWLRRLPADVMFANVQQVWDALGGMHEQRGPTRPLPAPDRRPRATEQSLLEVGRSAAAEVGGLLVGAVAVATGGVCASIRAVARRLPGLSRSG
jgi:hypothetical protein